MGFQNQVEAVAEIGSKCYREREELRLALISLVAAIEMFDSLAVAEALAHAEKVLGPNVGAQALPEGEACRQSPAATSYAALPPKGAEA